MSNIVTLNETEIRIVQHIGDKRYNYNRSIGAKATVYGSETPKDREYFSYAGEMAFCKIHNYYPDLTYKRMAPYDCLTPDKMTIDVKTTTRKDGKLMVKVASLKNKQPCDFYALMICLSYPTFRYAGFIHGVELIRSVRIQQSRNMSAPAYCALQRELTI